MNIKQKLKKKIQQTELQIKKMNLSGSNSEISMELQNSLILQKAILKKELENMEKRHFMEKLRKFLPHKKTLISDYFN